MPNQSQKPVDIGGQAVLEGVMMKGPDAIAITVRRPDKTMVVDYKKSEPLSKSISGWGCPSSAARSTWSTCSRWA